MHRSTTTSGDGQAALAEPRRIIIAVGLLAGASPDALRPVTKSMVEIAGEDDVAIAMEWALDGAAAQAAGRASRSRGRGACFLMATTIAFLV